MSVRGAEASMPFVAEVKEEEAFSEAKEVLELSEITVELSEEEKIMNAAIQRLQRLVSNNSPITQVIQCARFCDQAAGNSSSIITKFVSASLQPSEKARQEELKKLDLTQVPVAIIGMFGSTSESQFQRGKFNGFDSKV